MEEQGHHHESSKNDEMPGGLLYHYTDEQGLLGILESENIRATHFRFLNDITEREEAPKFLFAAIDELIKKDPFLSSEYWDGIRPALKKAWDEIAAYFVCFTEDSETDGDRLSQWRGYAPNRPGFGLGFNGHRLKSKAEEVMNSAILPTYLWKCLYDEEQKRTLARNSSETHAKAIKDWVAKKKCNPLIGDKEYRNEELGKSLMSFQDELLKLSAWFKHFGFREENEWRIVLYVHGELTNLDLIQFRPGRFGRTPFIEVPLGLKDIDSPLKRIVVGPAQDMEQSVARLRIELLKMGIHGVEVVPSKIPYRNW
jgi:hypothetical protein